jgi:predicted ester cyclase
MSDENKALIRNLLDGMWNQKDMSVADTYIDANLVQQGPFTDGLPDGPEGYRQFIMGMVSAFPDTHCTIDKQEADGDMVRTWCTYRGTQTGALMNIPPTGKKATVPVVFTDRIRNGKVVESMPEWDPEDMLRQLGVEQASS